MMKLLSIKKNFKGKKVVQYWDWNYHRMRPVHECVGKFSLTNPKNTNYGDIINYIVVNPYCTKNDIMWDCLGKDSYKHPGYYSSLFNILSKCGIIKYHRSKNGWSIGPNFQQWYMEIILNENF